MDGRGSRDGGLTDSEGNSVLANRFGSRRGQTGPLVLARMIFDKDNPAGRKKQARSWSWMDGDGREVLAMPSTWLLYTHTSFIEKLNRGRQSASPWLLYKLTDEGVQRVLTD